MGSEPSGADYGRLEEELAVFQQENQTLQTELTTLEENRAAWMQAKLDQDLVVAGLTAELQQAREEIGRHKEVLAGRVQKYQACRNKCEELTADVKARTENQEYLQQQLAQSQANYQTLLDDAVVQREANAALQLRLNEAVALLDEFSDCAEVAAFLAAQRKE